MSRLVRGRPGASPGDIPWSPEHGTLDAAALEGVDGVVHLAGEPILGRWTAAKRRAHPRQPVAGTALLARTLAGLARKPQCAGLRVRRAGYYGDRGDELLTEESAPGKGFLADVCREWEAAALPARRAGMRVVYLRTGLALA